MKVGPFPWQRHFFGVFQWTPKSVANSLLVRNFSFKLRCSTNSFLSSDTLTPLWPLRLRRVPAPSIEWLPVRRFDLRGVAEGWPRSSQEADAICCFPFSSQTLLWSRLS